MVDEQVSILLAHAPSLVQALQLYVHQFVAHRFDLRRFLAEHVSERLGFIGCDLITLQYKLLLQLLAALPLGYILVFLLKCLIFLG
jgi:hypothetical protein